MRANRSLVIFTRNAKPLALVFGRCQSQKVSEYFWFVVWLNKAVVFIKSNSSVDDFWLSESGCLFFNRPAVYLRNEDGLDLFISILEAVKCPRIRAPNNFNLTATLDWFFCSLVGRSIYVDGARFLTILIIPTRLFINLVVLLIYLFAKVISTFICFQQSWTFVGRNFGPLFLRLLETVRSRDLWSRRLELSIAVESTNNLGTLPVVDKTCAESCFLVAFCAHSFSEFNNFDNLFMFELQVVIKVAISFCINFYSLYLTNKTNFK